jgi:hypothetical protein
MSDDLVKVTVSDGKYTFIQRADGSCVALRYGEPWRENIFDGLMLGMAHSIEQLQEKLHLAINTLQQLASAPRFDESIDELIAKTLKDIE